MAESRMLRTGRLAVVPFGPRHLTPAYLSWLCDAALMRYSEQRLRTHTLESCRHYMESFSGTDNHFWAVEETQRGLGHIGTMTAYVDKANQVADVGILLGDFQARGQGYAGEAWRLVCGYLLTEAGLRKVTAGTLAANVPMLRVMERSGMVPDGVRRRQVLFGGQAVDVVHMAFFKDDPRAPRLGRNGG